MKKSPCLIGGQLEFHLTLRANAEIFFRSIRLIVKYQQFPTDFPYRVQQVLCPINMNEDSIILVSNP